MTAPERPSLWHRLAWAVGCGLAFMLVYNLTNHLAAARDEVGRWHFAWETAIPLVPWLILPYWTIDLLFVGGFLLCTSRAELRTLGLRVLAAVAIAAVFFLLVPLEPAFERRTDQGAWTPLFQALYAFDRPHNLFPSLHVAFAVLMRWTYARHLGRFARLAFHLWFALITVSTVLVHQHHLVDVAGGAVLALVVMHLIDEEPLPAWGVRATRGSRRLAALYTAGALLLAGGGWLLGGAWLLLWWPAYALTWVAVGYAGLGSRICRPRAAGPSVPARILLFPWLEVLGWSRRWWWRRPLPPVEIADGVWLGRIPDIPGWHGAVIDCSCEHRRRRPASGRYERVPLLDLAIAESPALRHLAERIEAARNEGAPVLVACGLGLGRSSLGIAAWLLHSGRAADADEAIALVGTRRPSIAIAAEARRCLDDLARLPATDGGTKKRHEPDSPAA